MADNAPEVVTLGEVLGAFVATRNGPLGEATSFDFHVAGAESNAAVGLARLGHAVTFIGRLGADGIGTAALRRLRGEGVDVRFVRTEEEAPTGILIREQRSLGPSEVTYRRAGSAGSRLDVEDVNAAAAVIAGARWLHLTGITPALSASARAAVSRAVDLAQDAGLTISLDVNLRRKLWPDAEAAPVLRELAGRVDVVLAGLDEARVVADQATDAPSRLARGIVELGPDLVVLKLGSDGAMAFERDRAEVLRPAYAVPAVVDPVGAGDAFSAGFIAARLEGSEVGRALEVANACGAAAVSALGDLTGAPTRVELDRLLGAAGGDDLLR